MLIKKIGTEGGSSGESITIKHSLQNSFQDGKVGRLSSYFPTMLSNWRNSIMDPRGPYLSARE